jgi:hypothetical protein
MQENPKPTKKQQEMLDLLRLYHWKVWVPDSQLAMEPLKTGMPTKKQIFAARRVCFSLEARRLVESSQNGLGGWAFRLTRGCREVAR